MQSHTGAEIHLLDSLETLSIADVEFDTLCFLLFLVIHHPADRRASEQASKQASEVYVHSLCIQGVTKTANKDIDFTPPGNKQYNTYVSGNDSTPFLQQWKSDKRDTTKQLV